MSRWDFDTHEGDQRAAQAERLSRGAFSVDTVAVVAEMAARVAPVVVPWTTGKPRSETRSVTFEVPFTRTTRSRKTGELSSYSTTASLIVVEEFVRYDHTADGSEIGVYRAKVWGLDEVKTCEPAKYDEIAAALAASGVTLE